MHTLSNCYSSPVAKGAQTYECAMVHATFTEGGNVGKVYLYPEHLQSANVLTFGTP